MGLLLNLIGSHGVFVGSHRCSRVFCWILQVLMGGCGVL